MSDARGATVNHLDEVRAILKPTLDFELKAVTETFYEELGDFAGRTLVSQFSWDAPWGVWEMHPAGDELVYLLEGDTDFILRLDGDDRRHRLSEPGSYVIVPKGVWHTAEPHRPSRALFVTPGQGTQNVESPPV
ncbi:MAG: hypothetical protein AAGG11_22585 [Pseudomonadota bacterium]